MVWKARARFIHKKFLVNYPDHEQDGIFEADPSLNKFLATSQASIASLKLQWAFEAEHNLEECYQIIEDYCNGGDGYLTEDVMRSACGLPVRQRNLQADEGVGNLINADVESDAEKDDKTKCWHTLRESMVTYLLSKDTESITVPTSVDERSCVVCQFPHPWKSVASALNSYRGHLECSCTA